MYEELIYKSIIDTIYKYKKIVIVSHVNPDGDALGSTLAFSLFVKKLGGEPVVIVPNDYPTFLAWMPGIQDVLIYDKNRNAALEIMNHTDLFCYLDFNTPSRTGIMYNDLCHLIKYLKFLLIIILVLIILSFW